MSPSALSQLFRGQRTASCCRTVMGVCCSFCVIDRFFFCSDVWIHQLIQKKRLYETLVLCLYPDENPVVFFLFFFVLQFLTSTEHSHKRTNKVHER